MNGVGGNGADVRFNNCSGCSEGMETGQLGGRSVVKTECVHHQKAHLECIRDNAKSLNKRDRCKCGPGMSLLRNSRPLLEDACQKGDLDALKLGLELKPNGDVTSALAAAAINKQTECFMTLSDALKNHVNEHKELCGLLARLSTGVGMALAGVASAGVAKAGVTTAVVASSAIVGGIVNMLVDKHPIVSFMSMCGFYQLVSSCGLSAFLPNIFNCIVLAVSGLCTLGLAHKIGYEFIGEKMGGQSICLEKGTTPLHIAAKENFLECMKALVHQCTEARNKGELEIIKSAFLSAAIFWYDGLVAILAGIFEEPSDSYKKLFNLTCRWNVNTANEDGNTPLHFAAENNSVRCLEALIKAGANINATNSKGWTALHFAAQNGCKESVENLLCFSSILKVNIKNNDGNTALDLAINKDSTEIAKILRTAGGNRAAFDRTDTVKARVNKKTNDDKTDLHSGIVPEQLYHFTQSGKMSPPAARKRISGSGFSGRGGRAAGSVCSNVAVNSGQFLNAVGINVNEKDNNGNTVLHKAGCGNKSAGVKDWSFSGYFENAWSAGRRLPASKSSENKAGGGNESAGVKDWYFSSFFENQRPAVELSASKSAEKPALLKYRSCVEERINTQVQPLNESLGIETLQKAVDNGLTETVKNMLAIDRSPGIKALHDAAKEGHTETIQKLLKIAPSLAKETDMLGRTALHVAAEKGHTAAIRTLWDNDHSLVKEKDSLGQTALHKAAREGHTEAIQALLKIDSPLAKEKDCRGRTALNIAARHGHTECEKLLKNAGQQFPQRPKARCSRGPEARCSKGLEAYRTGIIKSVYQQKSAHKTQM